MTDDPRLDTWPHHSEEEMLAVRRVLASGQVNYWSGAEGRAFEGEFAQYHRVPHAIGVANGSAALELALRALGIAAGDDVVVTPRSFVASASCVALIGARPIFADVDPVTQNITAAAVREVITPRTRALVPVHLAGWPCDMDALRELADELGLYLIEDCAQAHGASWRGQPVGSFGDAAAFSFCTDKIMTTGGEGGMVLFREEAPWRRAWSYKDHGKDWGAVYHQAHAPGYRWLHESFGTNWRLTEMQSAIGRVQLRKLPEWRARRQANAALLNQRLAEQPALRLTRPLCEAGHAYYKYYAFVRPEQLRSGWTRDRIVAVLQEQGIPCYQGICPEIYREQAFVDAGFAPASRLPVARELGETSIMLPVHPTLKTQHIELMAARVVEVLQRASLYVPRRGSSSQRFA